MTRQRRLLLACLSAAWVGMVLACGGGGGKTASPVKVETTEEHRLEEKAAAAPEEPEKPVPSLVRPGQTGASAYDEFPEPWRTRFAKAWEEELGNARRLLAVNEEGVKESEKKVREVTDYQKMLSADNVPGLTPAGLSSRRRRAAVDLEKAESTLQSYQKAARAYRDRIEKLEKNDPPHFVSEKERQEAEFAALPAAEQERRKANAERRRKAEAAKAELRRKAEAAKAEAARKAEEEYDANGLVLMLKTLDSKGHEFGGGEITGTVVNRRPGKLAYVLITFNLYDKSGARVGTALSTIDGLEPGGRWRFRAVTFTDFDRYKLSELSAF